MIQQRVNIFLQKFLGQPGVRKYASNIGWMFAEKVLRLIAGLFVGAYVARYLGPSQYGVLNYSISVLSLFATVSTLGLETIVIRELVRDPARKDRIIGTALTLRFIAASVTSALVVAFILVTPHEAHVQTVLLIMTATIFAEIFQVYDYYYQSQVISRYAVFSQMIALAGVSVFRITLVLQGADLYWFAVSYVLDPLIIAAGFLIFGSRSAHLKFATLRWDRGVARELMRYSWPLIFTALAITIYMRVDQIMIKWLMDDSANGIYGVAVRLSEMWNFIPMAICASVFPAILNAREISQELYRKRLQLLYDLMVAISVSVAIVMTFMSDFVVQILFGDAYRDAGPILSIYVWSGVFVFLGVANGKWIVAENLQRVKMYLIIISSILNVALNFYLIPLMGLRGAAFATLVAYGFAAYIGFAFSRRTFECFVASSRALNPFRLFGYIVKLVRHEPI